MNGHQIGCDPGSLRTRINVDPSGSKHRRVVTTQTAQQGAHRILPPRRRSKLSAIRTTTQLNRERDIVGVQRPEMNSSRAGGYVTAAARSAAVSRGVRTMVLMSPMCSAIGTAMTAPLTDHRVEFRPRVIAPSTAPCERLIITRPRLVATSAAELSALASCSG
jgi:hypothetical protein